MPHNDWRLRVRDIIESIEKIADYTDNLSRQQFMADDKTIDAVIRNLIVIGEAAIHMPPEKAQMYPQIPWSEMRGMRNVVIHEYFGISLAIVWETIKNDLPPLLGELRHILGDDVG